jgi:hypothetical protein
MAEQLPPDEDHWLGPSNTSWCGEEGLRSQIGDESYGMDGFGTYPSDNASHQTGCFYPEAPFPFKHTEPDVLVGSVNKYASFWGPLHVPSSQPSSLNPSLLSNSYDNRDFDVTELNPLRRSSLMLADVELPKASASKYWEGLDVPASVILSDVGKESLVVSTRLDFDS